MLRKKFYLLKMLYVKLGAWGLIHYLWGRYRNGRASQPLTAGIDAFSTYDFLRFSPFGNAPPPLAELGHTINWVVPDMGIGSGGHLNIFRLIMHLEKRGYVCRVVIVGHTHFNTAEEAHKVIREHFFPIEAEVSIGERSLKPAAITVATSWITAYQVRNFQSTHYRCYFVQDYEPYFHAHGSDYCFAEATYRMGFMGITAGQWLADKLKTEYGMQTTAMGFSYDHDLYRPLPRRNPSTRHIFFYARPVTPRRGFELGLLTLNLVAQQMPDIAFILAGWDASAYHIPFRYINAGNLALKELPPLYSECDAALVLSLTNLSLLPLELMACGCPVVSNRGANTEWLLNGSNAVLAEPTPEALSQAIIGLLQDEGRRQQLIGSAMHFATQTSWEKEAAKVARFFEGLPAHQARKEDA